MAWPVFTSFSKVIEKNMLVSVDGFVVYGIESSRICHQLRNNTHESPDSYFKWQNIIGEVNTDLSGTEIHFH